MRHTLQKMISLLFPLRAPSRRYIEKIQSYSDEEFYRRVPRRDWESKHIHAILPYKHPLVRTLIWQIKYKRDTHAIRCGGYILSQALLQNQNETLVLIPIPSSRKRQNERGYNQCELLVGAVAQYVKVAKNGNAEIKIRSDILVRAKHTEKQALKKRKERVLSAHNIFEVINKPKNKTEADIAIVIIDDVVTTGSTLSEAIRVLSIAGYKNIRGLAIAH
jgi:competence protein ComFC